MDAVGLGLSNDIILTGKLLNTLELKPMKTRYKTSQILALRCGLATSFARAPFVLHKFSKMLIFLKISQFYFYSLKKKYMKFYFQIVTIIINFLKFYFLDNLEKSSG